MGHLGFRQLGEFLDHRLDEAYSALPAAALANKVNPSVLTPHNPSAAAEMVLGGRIPDQAGLIELGGRVAAYDLVSARLPQSSDYSFVELGPAPKSAVDTESRVIRGVGVVVLSELEEGWVKVVAEVAKSDEVRWKDRYKNIGDCAVRHLGLEAPKLEIEEIKPDGSIVAWQPKRYF